MIRKVTEFDDEILIGRVLSMDESKKGNLILTIRTNHEDKRDNVETTSVKVVAINSSGANHAERMKKLSEKLDNGMIGTVLAMSVRLKETEKGTLRGINWWTLVQLPVRKLS